MKKQFLIATIFSQLVFGGTAFASTIVAATGAAGNWTSGGAWVGGVAPTAADSVQITATTTSITIDAGALARGVDFTGFTGTATMGSTGTLTIGDATTGLSNIAFKMVSGCTFSPNSASTITFADTSGTQQTIDTGGKTMGNLVFNAVGGNYAFTANSTTSTSSKVTLTKGTLHTDGAADNSALTHSWGQFDAATSSSTRVLTLGTSAITIKSATYPGWYNSNATGMTFSGASSTLTFSGSFGTHEMGSFTYGTVNCTGATFDQINGSPTIGTFSSTNSGIMQFNNNPTFTTFTRTGTAAKTDSLNFQGSVTISGTFTLAGNSAANRLLIYGGSSYGNSSTITNTGATQVWSYVDFRDIALSSSYNCSAITGLCGDAGGNSGITFTVGANQYYQIGANANFSTNANWFLATNGGGGAGHTPLPQDTAIFDANSITAGSVTITADMPRMGSVNWTGVANTPTFNLNSTGTEIYGSLTLVSGMNLTSGTTNFPTFDGRTTYTLTSAGKSFGALTLRSKSGTLTLQDTFTATGTVTVSNGTFAAGSNAMNCAAFSSANSNTRAISGTGTWTMSGTGTVWDTSTTTSLTATGMSSSTLVFSDTSATAKTVTTGTKTFGNVTYSGDNITQAGTPTWAAMAMNNAGLTNGLKLTAGTTTTVTSFTTNGSAGNIATLVSTSGGSAATLSDSSGTNSVSYTSIKDSTATGGATWSADGTCTNVSGNTGWVFGASTAGFFGE